MLKSTIRKKILNIRRRKKNQNINFSFLEIFKKIKKNNLKILVSDNSSLIKILNQDIKLDSIFLVNELNQASSNSKISSEVININIPFKMSDIY